MILFAITLIFVTLSFFGFSFGFISTDVQLMYADSLRDVTIAIVTSGIGALLSVSLLSFGARFVAPWSFRFTLPAAIPAMIGIWIPIWPTVSAWVMEAPRRLIMENRTPISDAEGWLIIAVLALFGTTALCVNFVYRLFRNPPKLLPQQSKTRESHRSKSDLFGAARLGDWQQISKRVNKENAGSTSQIILGEAFDPRKRKSNYDHDDPTTWGQGGKAPVIRMSTGFSNGHSLILTGSSGGKTSAFVIPACMTYRDKLVVVDPGGEALEKTREIRKAMGRKIIEVNLDSTIDIFKLIGPHLTTPMAYLQLADNMILRERDSEFSKHYAEATIGFLAGLLEFFHLKSNVHPLVCLAEVQSSLETNLQEFCELIVGEKPPTSVVRSVRTLSMKGERYLNNATGAFTESFRWMAADETVAMVTQDSQPDLSLSDPNTDIFITLKTEELKQYKGLVRLILGCFTYHKMNLPNNGTSMLMIVDEAATFGYFPLFEVLRDRARKHQLHLMLIYQGMGQIIDGYGRSGAADWKSVAVRSYSRIEDEHELETLSRLIGSFTAEVKDASTSESGHATALMSSNVSQSESMKLQKVQLITPDELRTLPMDAQVLLFQGEPPIVCSKAFYFRRKDNFQEKTKPTNGQFNLDTLKSALRRVS